MEGKRAAVFCRCGWNGWNGKCSQNEMSLYPLPTKLYVGRGYACSWRTVIKQWTDVGFVEADEGRGRGRSKKRYSSPPMTGKSGDSMEVRSEGESRVKGNTSHLFHLHTQHSFFSLYCYTMSHIQ